MVARFNRTLIHHSRLEEFLSGVSRVSLDPVRRPLRDVQDNRCFYCDTRIASAAEVDHFIPWSRHPDNGIENLVVADRRCNSFKRDFVPATEHLERWRAERFGPSGGDLPALAEIAKGR